MRAYISGAITDNTNCEKQFSRAEEWLKLCGYTVINPLSISKTLPFTEHKDFLKVDFCLIEMCDTIYMLRGWQKSKGACAELSYAKAIGKTVKYEDKQINFKRSFINDSYND